MMEIKWKSFKHDVLFTWLKINTVYVVEAIKLENKVIKFYRLKNSLTKGFIGTGQEERFVILIQFNLFSSDGTVPQTFSRMCTFFSRYCMYEQ